MRHIMYMSLDLCATNEAELDFIINFDGKYRMGASTLGIMVMINFKVRKG